MNAVLLFPFFSANKSEGEDSLAEINEQTERRMYMHINVTVSRTMEPRRTSFL